jgi:hypothetical protein
MIPYPAYVEAAMKKYYDTLSEKDKRRYAAVEVLKLGRGATKYIVKVLGCSRRTVLRGLKDLSALPKGSKRKKRIRKAGGGRKRYDETHPDIDEKFLEVLKKHTAGDPMDETVVWTDLLPWQIAKLLEREYEIRVSKTVIRKLFKKHNYRRRKAQKKRVCFIYLNSHPTQPMEAHNNQKKSKKQCFQQCGIFAQPMVDE